MVRAIGLAIVVGVWACAPTAAQDAAPAGARDAAYRQVAKSCAADAARFCPPIDQAPAVPRDQVMCLKSYRVDLTLSCRRAVNAAMAATQPAP